MSHYICSTSTCAIATSKASFPVDMNCPVCQQPLSLVEERSALSDEDEQLIVSLPYVIAYPLKRTLLEKHAWTRINLFKDTFLNYLKYLGLLTASEFFNSPFKDKKMVALFHQTLAEPSFGTWVQFIRETLNFLKEQDHAFFCPEIPLYSESVETGKKPKLFKGEIEYIDGNGDVQLTKQKATAINMLINFRNRYLGHGLTLDETASQKLWEEYFPIFRDLLEQMNFTKQYPMFKYEHGESFLLGSAEIVIVEKGSQTPGRVWIENEQGKSMDILPFYVVPGEVSLGKEDKEQILTYESYTGKTIKFFSPEGTEKQTSGKILEKLNLLLRDKQKEQPYSSETFTKEVFLTRVADENKLILDTLIAEKKVIPGVYVHREEMEIKLREWIGARANIFFIAAEAGSGKTNLVVEMQKQYTERGLPSLLIRTSRMEKQTLTAQLAYLLNIDEEKGLRQYNAIAGNQADPTFVLIDGLNEAINTEEIWREILEISKIFQPGSLKFVITSRANTKADIERYTLSEADEHYMYGDNKVGEKDLISFVHWLTPLNMVEMKEAWEDYVNKDKNKFKPLFSFDDLARVDRELYDQLSNPLILRLFLETYHGKSLPKKGSKYLNIWKDWLAHFSEQEQAFLKLLADTIWEEGKNELLLDDILKNNRLKPYFNSDLINAPYNRLKNLGWISRYVKNQNACLAFTVEGALLHLLGAKLKRIDPTLKANDIKEILKTGNKLKSSSAEVLLRQKALEGDLSLITDLIDIGIEHLELCVNPLLIFLKTYGSQTTIDMILKNPTEYDWIIFGELLEELEALQLFSLKSDFSNELYQRLHEDINEMNLHVAVKLLDDLCFPENTILLNLIENQLAKSKIETNSALRIKKSLAYYYSFNGFPEKSIQIYQDIYNFNTIQDATILNLIGVAYDNCGDSKNAVHFYSQTKIILVATGKISKLLGFVNFNLARYENDLEEKIKLYEESLMIFRQLHGDKHKDVADTLAALGLSYLEKGAFEEALKFFNDALAILSEIGADLRDIYNYLGYYYRELEDFEKSFIFYEKALQIAIKKVGQENDSLVSQLTRIGPVIFQLDNDQKSLDFFKRIDEIINKKTDFKDFDSVIYIKSSLGYLHFYLSDYDAAIQEFKLALEVQKDHPSEYSLGLINDIYYYLAYALYCKKDYTESIGILEKLGKLKKHEVDHESFLDYNELLGNCLFYLERYNDAILTYKKVLKEYDDPIAKSKILDLIAACYEHLKEFDRAVQFYQKCLKIVTNDQVKISKLIFRIGFCHQQINDFTLAIEAYKKGLLVQNSSSCHFHIAQCYEALNERENAFNYYIQSAEIRKDDPDLGIESVSTQEAISNAKRLAKEFNKEHELPDWMKDQ